ncbi:MAG TPA: recombinase family protein [Burkholderiales bacterium]|nr:recombinase family protein [Burkholderiales bacterium]
MTTVQPKSETDPQFTAASYERVSRQVQALYGHGLKRQERNVDEMARDNGVVLPPDLRFRDGVDDNASGAAWELPDLDRCMQAARDGRFKTLLIPTSDRWTRDTPKGLWMTRQIRAYGVRVVWGDIPDVPQATDGNPYSEHWRQKMEVEAFMDAELERNKIRWRTMNGRRDKAAAGRVVGQGAAPYGYAYVRDNSPKRLVCGLAVVEVQADVVRELYARARTMAIGDLLQWLAAERIPPPGAGRTFRKVQRYTKNAGTCWNDLSVYRILTSRLYLGEYTYHTQAFPVPAIVPADLFEEVGIALASRKSRRGAARNKTESDEFLFRGRLICEPCSARTGTVVLLHAKRANNMGERYYLCPFRFPRSHGARFDGRPRCPLPSIRAEVLETHAWAALMAALRDPVQLRIDIEDARTRRRLDDHGREDRRRAIEGSIAQQERQLAGAARRIAALEAEGTEQAGEELPIQAQLRDEAKELLVRLRRDLREVQAMPGVGVSADEAAELERLAAMVDEVEVTANAAERRHLIDLVGLRARIGDEGESVVVQVKPKRETMITWAGVISIAGQASSDSPTSLLNFVMQSLPSGRLVFAA